MSDIDWTKPVEYTMDQAGVRLIATGLSQSGVRWASSGRVRVMSEGVKGGAYDQHAASQETS